MAHMRTQRMIGGKWFAVCERCGKIVRRDKPLLGGVHFCVTEEEERHPAYPAWVAARCERSVRELMDVE